MRSFKSPAAAVAVVVVVSLSFSSGCSRFQRYAGAGGAAGAVAGGLAGPAVSSSVSVGEGAVMGGAGGGLIGAYFADDFKDEEWEGMNSELARLETENDDLAAELASIGNTLSERDAALADLDRQLEAERLGRLDAENRLAMVEADANDSRVALERMENDLHIRQVALEKAQDELSGLRDEFGDGVEVSSGDRYGGRGISLTILDDVLFRPGSATLAPEGEMVLSNVADTIRANYPAHELLIEGHTDSAPITKSGWNSNWELGSARALAVLTYLREYEAIPGQRLSAITYADTRPMATNATPEGRAQNRRAVIVIMPPSPASLQAPAIGQPASSASEVAYGATDSF